MLFSSCLFLVGETGLVVQKSLPQIVQGYLGLKNGWWKVLEIWWWFKENVQVRQFFGYIVVWFGLFFGVKLVYLYEARNLQYVPYMQRVLAPVLSQHMFMWNISLSSTKVNHCEVMKQKVSLLVMIRRQELVWNLFSVLWAEVLVVDRRLYSVRRNVLRRLQAFFKWSFVPVFGIKCSDSFQVWGFMQGSIRLHCNS